MQSAFGDADAPIVVELAQDWLAPFLPMPAAELCDRPVAVEQVWAGPPLLSCETG